MNTLEVTNILIKEYNDLPAGRDKLYPWVHSKYPFISIPMVERFLKNCETHQVHRANKKFNQSAIYITSSKPLERLHIDLIYMDKLKGYNFQFEYLMTVIDHFSHKVWVTPLRDRTSLTVALALESILNTLPRVSVVVSDRGSEFLLHFDDMLLSKGIRHIYTNAKSAWENGIIEGFNKILKTYLFRWMTNNRTNRYFDYLPILVENYNNSKNSATLHTPNEVFNYKTPFEPIILRTKLRNENRMKKLNKSRSYTYEVGEIVRISVDILYQLLPKAYKSPSEFKKSYKVNWSFELFTITKIVGREYISGYNIRLNDKEFRQLIKPHHIDKVPDPNNIIRNNVIGNQRIQPERRIRQNELPITQMEERRLEPTRNELLNPPNLDDIFEEDNDDLYDENDDVYY